MVSNSNMRPTLLARGSSHMLALAALAAPAWSTDWVVDDDGGPGVDFQEIQPAIAAASPGDTLLIREGDYSTLRVHKSLTILRDGPGSVRVRGISHVSGLGPDSDVQISGLHFLTAQSTGVCLQLFDNLGSVWIADCLVWGNDSENIFIEGDEALSCKNSQDVGLIRCTLRGGAGADYGFSPGPEGLFDAGDGGAAVLVEASKLQTFDCLLRGGYGGTDWGGYGNDGYTGGSITANSGAQVFASRTQLDGGSYGVGSSTVWLTGGAVLRQFESTINNQPADNFPSADSTPICFGLHATCPCGNAGFGGAGCGNSFGTDGGRLSLGGSANVSADTAFLQHTGLPAGTPLLYFQGTLDVGHSHGSPLGDGLLCAGGSIIRLGTRISTGAEDNYGYGVGSDSSLSIRGQLPGGGATRYYQVWYREPNSSCAAGSFNLSNGLVVVWEP